ncbi:signal transduction histidine kinase [Litorivivens lipolytica]|uniref:histidine kinase n=1 Tax=Litorivivens lipolytica TaxID=1524264 RepID=A0A7W4Z6G4_9GAMM|nr:HAMP domain-containing sensor histidine kinase [Litorivivens lipolytica]MBB3046876.1 signal transduction histidine kinase [Litorivivens lipolytica]
MILSKIFSSFTFRFMSGYVAGLSITVFLVLAAIYTLISRDYFTQVHNTIQQELDALTETYQEGGASAVEKFVDVHAGPDRLIRFFFLVVDENYEPIAGNLDRWPDPKQYRDGWLGFDLKLLSGEWDEVGTEFVARSRTLPTGETVMVARHYADVINSAKLVSGALTRSLVATIILGIIGGAIVAGRLVRRIDDMNQSLNRIMSGDLTERVELHDSHGDFRRMAVNLNKMLDKIEQLMLGMRQVSDNIAHDLRTPLTRLRNKLSDLQQSSNEPEKVQALIDEADGLLATFSALLRIAQVESGNPRSGFTEIDIKTILLDVIELYEPLALEKEQQVETDLATVPATRGDKNLLFQAIANLVDNAIKYTPDGGRVMVRLWAQQNQIVIEVSDSGPGVSPAEREKVLQRFYRVEASRSQQPGNGLGLSLVNAVVKLHGGSVQLADNFPGLRVSLRMPVQ